MAAHDNAYKHLFSHPQAVEDLLRGFVAEDWVKHVDFATLEKVSGSYVTDDLRDREDDIVWRLQLSGPGGTPEWLYVYLLLEFQSTIDPHMAVRVMAYVALLYQDLIKSARLPASGKLPAVFPLVLYNGERPWTAAREVEQLIDPVPGGLAAYRPRLCYFLLDEGRVPGEQLAQPENTVASILELERSLSPEEIGARVAQLAARLGDPRHRELRRALAVWVNRVVLRRFAPQGPAPEADDLPEVSQMISERVEQWTQQWLQQGIQQGMQRGIEQGIERGIEQGVQQGEATVLRRLLVRRFGALPEPLEARIAAAGLDQIEAWCDRIIDAKDLAAVFDEH